MISKWRVLTRGKYFWARSVGSTVIGDTVTVTLTILGTFLGRMPSHAYLLNLFVKFIFPELVIMVVFSSIGAVPAALLAKLVAKSEGLNHYDVGVVFNPFKFNDDEVNSNL